VGAHELRAEIDFAEDENVSDSLINTKLQSNFVSAWYSYCALPGRLAWPDAESRLKTTIEAIDSYRKNHDDRGSKLDWSFGLFPLNATAWSTAASTGAVSYMNYSEVQDYTRA
jgi:hypothetical protein